MSNQENNNISSRMDDWFNNMKLREQEAEKVNMLNKTLLKEKSKILEENKQLITKINNLEQTINNLQNKVANRERLNETKTQLIKNNTLLQRQVKELTCSDKFNKNDSVLQDLQKEINDLKIINKSLQEEIKELNNTLINKQNGFDKTIKHANEKYETLSKEYNKTKTKLEESIQKDEFDNQYNKYLKDLTESHERYKSCLKDNEILRYTIKQNINLKKDVTKMLNECMNDIIDKKNKINKCISDKKDIKEFQKSFLHKMK